MLSALIGRFDGLRCDAVDPAGEATCWARISPAQPGGICDECWRLLATDGEPAQRILLANEPDLPSWVADILAADNQSLVRANLAGRDSLEGEARRALLQPDEAGEVARRLARRADLTPDEQRILVYSHDVATLRILAGNTSEPELRDLLARHPDDGVRTAATHGHYSY